MIKDGVWLRELISLPNPHLTASALSSNYIMADKSSQGMASSRLNYKHTPPTKDWAAYPGGGHTQEALRCMEIKIWLKLIGMKMEILLKYKVQQ